MSHTSDHNVDMEMAGRVGKTVLVLLAVMVGLIILANVIA
jgi:hypothetical protein